MRDGTYVDPIYASGVIPIGVLGFAIFILAVCFMWNAERRAKTRAKQHPDTPYDWAREGDFRDKRADFAAWDREVAG